jgi:anti-sigma B factor antagonist
MEISSQKLERGVKIKLSGEVDMHSSPDVRQELLKAARAEEALVLVNMAEVTYIDSSGLATLVECLQHMTDYGGRLVLVSAGKTVRDVFSIARLDTVFNFCQTEDEALEA